MSDNIYKSGEYLKHNPSWDIADSPWKANHIIKMLEKNQLKPQSICEVGCGAGEILRQLFLNYSRDIKYSGYEISPDAFKMINSKENHEISYFLEDVFLNDKRLDVVMAIDVIEHVEDSFSFLRKFKDKGEYKIFHIPLDLSAIQVMRGWPLLHSRAHVGHIHYFTKDTAIATLKDCGYEIIDFFYTFGQMDRPKSIKSFLFSFLRRMFYRKNSDISVRILGGASLMVLAR